MAEALTSGVSHVGVTVKNLEKSVAFFEAVGFKKVGGIEAYPSVFVSDGATLITLWKAKDESPAEFDRTKNIGLHHLAIKVPTVEALNKVYDIVSKIEDVKIEFPPQPLPSTGITRMMCFEPSDVRYEFAHHLA